MEEPNSPSFVLIHSSGTVRYLKQTRKQTKRRATGSVIKVDLFSDSSI
jgi:hypothetical protein